MALCVCSILTAPATPGRSICWRWKDLPHFRNFNIEKHPGSVELTGVFDIIVISEILPISSWQTRFHRKWLQLTCHTPNTKTLGGSVSTLTMYCGKEVAGNSPHCGRNVGNLWRKPYPATKLIKVSENSEKGAIWAQKNRLFRRLNMRLVGDAKIMLTLSLFWDKMQVFYHQWFTNRDFFERRKRGKNSRILWGKTGIARMPYTGGRKNSFHPQKAPRNAFDKYSINAGKNNPSFSVFCRTPTNAQKRLAVPNFPGIATRVALRLIFATRFDVKIFCEFTWRKPWSILIIPMNYSRKLVLFLIYFRQNKEIWADLWCLLYSAISVEQTTEERNLLYFSVCILRIWQYHSAIKSGMRSVVIPILQIFFHGKTKLIFIGKDNSVQALCF